LSIGLDGLGAQDIFGDKQNICRAFCQAAHEIWIPLGSEGDVDADAPSFFDQALLQIAANAVKHLKLESIAGNVFADGEGFGLVNDGFVVGRQAMEDSAFHQGFHEFDVVGVHFGLLLVGDVCGLFVSSLAEADTDAVGEEFVDVRLGAAHVGLDDGADIVCIAGDAVEFMDEVEGALGVGGAFHVDANEVPGRHAGGLGDQSANDVVGHSLVDVEAHVGEFETDVGVQFVGRDLIEEVVVELGAGSGFVGVGDIFAEVVDGDTSSELIDGGGGANGVGDLFAGYEAGGGALAEA